jgi:hypothetical protein
MNLLKMKNRIILISILISKLAFGQPNPQERYPERIKAITEQLKTDSLNYELIWERLEMKVNLAGRLVNSDDIFSINIDSLSKAKRNIHFDEFNTDFIKIYNSVIKEKKYNIVEEGDFYLNRMWFYENMHEIDKAIEDAKYLRDSASYSRYSERGDYYNNFALYSLFNLHVINRQYEEALEAINTMLDKKESESPEVFFAGHGSFLNCSDKISLFEHFKKNEEIIPFIKENCIKHFAFYFENLESKDYYVNAAKDQSLYFLKLLVDYMKKYQDKELAKYEGIYNRLSYKMNENYETINPNIDDTELRTIVSEIK